MVVPSDDPRGDHSRCGISPFGATLGLYSRLGRYLAYAFGLGLIKMRYGTANASNIGFRITLHFNP